MHLSVLIRLAIWMAGTWSKEDTNDKHLNNFVIGVVPADESSAFAEKSAKQHSGCR
jgi:hypothetical protein